MVDGMSTDCSEEKFLEYVEDVKPVAQKLIDSLEQERT
jgi:BarA-like signal transduction histidine kinase